MLPGVALLLSHLGVVVPTWHSGHHAGVDFQYRRTHRVDVNWIGEVADREKQDR
jgi:hypothetical protein